jgi:ribosomal protein S18 acetylase RimI-like enzyme
MTAEVYDKFMERLLPEYAAEHVVNGRWSSEESLAGAQKEIARLLPQGNRTSNEKFLSVWSGTPEEIVGGIWLHLDGKNGFLYDLWIDSPHHGKGYDREGMVALEQFAKEHGAARIAVHVFGHNGPAREFYRELGYRERDVVVAKELP